MENVIPRYEIDLSFWPPDYFSSSLIFSLAVASLNTIQFGISRSFGQFSSDIW